MERESSLGMRRMDKDCHSSSRCLSSSRLLAGLSTILRPWRAKNAVPLMLPVTSDQSVVQGRDRW
jgi:hypothetical protein